jgi:hypothetical protein
MKMNLKFFFVAAMMLAFAGCRSKKETAEVPIKDFPSIESILPIQEPSDINYKGQKDNFEILEKHLDGQFLMVKLAYSGGCNEHFFEVSWDGNYMKSLPPQVNLNLTHVNNDDVCRARIEKEFAIDLHKLFLNTPNNVFLILNGNVEGKLLASPQE